MREPDAAFADPRQAVLYDVLDDDRSDLDAYVAIAGELGARHVIDIGCGTGSLAVRLAGQGLSVVGVDPAAASIDIAPTTVDLPDGRTAVVTRTVTVVDLPLVTFEGSTTIGDEILTSSSTLRFRDRPEIEQDLLSHGFIVSDVRDAPDRPGKEHVFIARAG